MSLVATVVQIPGGAEMPRDGVHRLIPVHEVEEFSGQGLVFERRQLEGGEECQGLALADLKRPLTSPRRVIPPAVHGIH